MTGLALAVSVLLGDLPAALPLTLLLASEEKSGV